MQGLTFEYPAWYLFFCLLVGLAVAAILYYKDRSLGKNSRFANWLLGALRWVGYSLLAALLLSPLLRYLQTDEQAPIVVMARDASESITNGTDTTAFSNAWNSLAAELGSQYEVVSYTFGDEVRRAEETQAGFADKHSNISELLSEVGDVYSNRNLGALIVATDGIYNQGANPAYTRMQIQAPVYTVGLGDTMRRRDLLVRRVFHNKIAYLNDRFSIQIDVSARNASGTQTKLRVLRLANGLQQNVFEKDLTIDGNDFFTTEEVILNADRAGVERYRIILSPISDEVTRANNSRDIFVDVLDARQKILILANSPHPDMTAIKQSLLDGKNNEVETAYVDKFTGNIKDYDLLILHQLPSSGNSALLQQAQELNKPVWYILGDQSDLTAFNQQQELVRVQPRAGSSNDVSALLDPGFRLFSVSEELRQIIRQFPPLASPFGEYSLRSDGAMMLRQRIGQVETDFPLLVLGESRGRRTAVLTGTGLWQWRLFDYLENNNHERFGEFVSQITQYLSIQEDKRRFRVSVAENIFDENEPVQMDAELYNSNYELINESDVAVTITDAEGRDYEYTFTRTATAYTLNAGILPVGNYRFRATTEVGGENLTYNGRFSVQPVEIERFVLEADHGMLRQLSDRFGGDFLLPGRIGDLPQTLADRGNVKPILYQTVTTRSVINLKWIFFLLLALLSIEWFLRRYWGGY